VPDAALPQELEVGTEILRFLRVHGQLATVTGSSEAISGETISREAR